MVGIDAKKVFSHSVSQRLHGIRADEGVPVAIYFINKSHFKKTTSKFSRAHSHITYSILKPVCDFYQRLSSALYWSNFKMFRTCKAVTKERIPILKICYIGKRLYALLLTHMPPGSKDSKDKSRGVLPSFRLEFFCVKLAYLSFIFSLILNVIASHLQKLRSQEYIYLYVFGTTNLY